MPDFLLTILLSSPIYKYGLLFVITIIEGPLVTMGVGFLGSQGYFDLVTAYTIICAADLIGDSMYYGIGFFGRKRFSKEKKIGLHINPEKLEKMEHLLHKHCGKTILIAKLTHLGGVPILVASGLAKINFFQFIKYNAIATFPKSFAFLMLGYYFGKNADIINSYIKYGTFIISGIIILISILYLFMSKPLEEKIFKNTK